MKLHTYQQVGADWLASRRAGLLADEMGLGKSAQAIVACDLVFAQRVVVLCPASVCENWRREFARFSTLGIVPEVHSYDMAVRHPIEGRIDVLILDEGHYLKNPEAKRTKVVYGSRQKGEHALVYQADRVWVLTGTPMPNHHGEIWPMLHALFPAATAGSKAGRPMTYWPFVNTYGCVRITDYGTQIRLDPKRAGLLASRLKPIMLRRFKHDVLKDLPPITWGDLFVSAEITDAMAAESGEAKAIRRVLDEAGVDGLRSLAAGGETGTKISVLRRLTGLAKVAPVSAWVTDWLDSVAKGRKIVLFAYHREVCERLLGALPDSVAITGDSSPSSRQRAVDTFQNDPECRVFVGQIQAAGTGITLTAASDLLFVESSWSPAENAQAAMRIHRIGQDTPCIVRFVTLAGSIDEVIQRVVAEKTASLTQILGGNVEI